MKIEFMGDSITDAGRNTERGSMISIGQGYAMLVSAELGAKYPGAYTFVNKGVSGNRVVDVYARIKADMWNEAPDVLSVLIGVNDVWHEQNGNGVEADRFEAVYRLYLSDTLKKFPAMKILLLEPFVLRGRATDGAWETFDAEVHKRAEITKRLAAEFGLCFVPLQAVFDTAAEKASADLYLADGVHPTPAGHYLIAEAWKRAFSSYVTAL